MVGCDGRNWHQYIADYCLHADKELVAKVSQDANERKIATQIQPGRVLPSEATAPGREPQKTGETTEVLAEIAGTGIVQLNLELISAYPPKLTYYNILLYIYLYLKVININKPREIARDQYKS